MPASATCIATLVLLRLLAILRLRPLKRRDAPVMDSRSAMIITTTSRAIPWESLRLFTRRGYSNTDVAVKRCQKFVPTLNFHSLRQDNGENTTDILVTHQESGRRPPPGRGR